MSQMKKDNPTAPGDGKWSNDVDWKYEFERSSERNMGLQEAYDELKAKLERIQIKVNQQAEDEGLWFKTIYVTEEYLQRELRELHRVIENARK